MSLGCLGFGPQAGITFDGNPTLGWEVSALSVSTGQSFRLGLRERGKDTDSEKAILERPWDQRTYVVWEPGILIPVAGNAPDSWMLMAGGGFSLGGRWDVREVESDEGEVHTVVDPAATGGFWVGGNESVPQAPSGCGGFQPRFSGSLSIGVRGDEIYVTPKLGVFLWPQGICLDGL